MGPIDGGTKPGTAEIVPLDAILRALADDERASKTSREWAARLLRGEKWQLPEQRAEEQKLTG